MSTGLRYGVAALLGGLLLLVTACEHSPGEVTTQLTLERAGWDTVRARVEFSRWTLLGDTVAVAPDTAARFVLFDADYDTLYAGSDTVIPVPDMRLGDREPLMVEVCGLIQGKSLCEQAGVHASPKRIRSVGDISYPDDEDFEEGSYAVRFSVERERFGGGGWEPAETPANLSGYVLAYVANQTDPPVKVPLRSSRGRFDLARLDGYNDFRYHLRSQLHDGREARVHFDVYAGFPEQTARRVATVEKRVRHKSPEERRAEVRYYAEHAAERILDTLGDMTRDVRVYVDEWRFDPKEDVYQADLELRWGRGLFSRTYELSGILQVGERGAEARFRAVQGNRRARALWQRRVDARELDLGPIDPPALKEIAPSREDTTAVQESMAWTD